MHIRQVWIRRDCDGCGQTEGYEGEVLITRTEADERPGTSNLTGHFFRLTGICAKLR